tara:strand:- start:6075 stop:6644 length:570 start_codon:yes stop_codon:yes gene_type:complete
MILFGLEIPTAISMIGGLLSGTATIIGIYNKCKTKKKPKKIITPRKNANILNIQFKGDLETHRIFIMTKFLKEALDNESINTKIIVDFIKSLEDNLKTLISDVKSISNKSNPVDKYIIQTMLTGVVQKLERDFDEDFFIIRTRMFRSCINNALVSKLYNNHNEIIWAIMSSMTMIVENIINDYEMWLDK